MIGHASANIERPLAEQPPAGETSLADALAFAVRIHRAGDIDNAERVYRRILEVLPEQPDALNFLAMIENHHGRLDDAIALMTRSLAADPDRGERYNNLGNLFMLAERTEEAAAAYEQAIARCPEMPATFNNLGILYRAYGRFDAAERAYERALELDPENVEALNNCGNLYVARGQPYIAIKYYARALVLRPRDRVTRQYIAFAYVALGDLQSAADTYRECLEDERDHPGIRHLIAALSGENVPPRASDAYVETTFDAYAESFDAKLAHLEYRAPQLTLAAVQKAGFRAEKELLVLDAGCGTGLCGPLLAPYAARLVGVDLSSRMLDRARPRGVYDELVKAELTRFLQSRREAYDLIVSADTLCYFGALEAALNAAAGALREDGSLIFTLERAEEVDAPDGHRLNPHGRYSHTRDYVERVLANAGFEERVFTDAVLRRECASPVYGLVAAARKTRTKAGVE